jgi:23S rRNA pseudouridine2604 synthase
MSKGVPILNTVTRPCEIKRIKDYEFKIILTQGLNRQIRRMCEYLGYRVKKLKRIRIMNIKLDIPLGEWRYFNDQEFLELKGMLSKSSSVHEK